MWRARAHAKDGVPPSKATPAEQEALPFIAGSPVAQHVEVEPPLGDAATRVGTRSELALTR